MIPLPNYKHTAKFALVRLGLTASLCLDAGDIASYDGTSQQWNDVSGSGNHFYRGTTSGADATDPTFNGVPGARTANEYWSFDGGDIFTPVAPISFADNWHKDGALFTALCVIYTIAPTSARYWAGTSDSGNVSGLRFVFSNTNGYMQVACYNGTTAQIVNSVLSVNTNAWNYAAVRVNENGGGSGANASRFNVSGATALVDANYTAPSAVAPSALAIAGRGGTATTAAMFAGDRLALVVMVNGTAWTAAQLEAFRQIMRTRFPGI